MQSCFLDKDGVDFHIDYYSGIGFSEDQCALHSHPFHEFSLISAGDITYASKDFVDHIDDKCFIFSRAHQLHNPYINQKAKYERYQIQFHSDLLPSFIPEYTLSISPLTSTSGIWRVPERTFNHMQTLMETMLDRYETDRDSQSAFLEFRLLTTELMLLATDIVIKSADNSTSVTATYVDEVIKYIQDYYYEDLNLTNLCNIFFVSNTKLANDFKKKVGMTVGKFLTLTRIEAAKTLLREGLSVNTVARKCGYPGTSYFIKLFYEYTNLTPLKFQQITTVNKNKTDLF